jgi:hypothetical protein
MSDIFILDEEQKKQQQSSQFTTSHEPLMDRINNYLIAGQ